MTTLFLLVTGVCQSLNELGVVSVTKKWSGQNRTSRTACYGPALFFYAGEAIVLCGDGRCDSPGSSAKLCSYTLMDVKTNAIMHKETLTCEQVSCVFCCCFMKLYQKF